MNKRDLLADLEAIRKGTTLFGDPNPGVNTQYELLFFSHTRRLECLNPNNRVLLVSSERFLKLMKM